MKTVFCGKDEQLAWLEKGEQHDLFFIFMKKRGRSSDPSHYGHCLQYPIFGNSFICVLVLLELSCRNRHWRLSSSLFFPRSVLLRSLGSLPAVVLCSYVNVLFNILHEFSLFRVGPISYLAINYPTSRLRHTGFPSLILSYVYIPTI